MDSTPVSPITQLSYVLPVSAQHMLPTNMERAEDKLEISTGLTGSLNGRIVGISGVHAIMPHIDIDYLERLGSSVGSKPLKHNRI